MESKLSSIKEQIRFAIEKNKVIDDLFKKGSEKSKVEKEILGLIAIVIGVIFYFLMFGLGSLVDIVGWVYPMYCSLRAIQSPAEEEDKRWLMYWIFYAMIKILETCVYFLVSRIPFYNLLKLAFFVWSFHPVSQGSSTIYDLVVKTHVLPLLGIAKTDSSDSPPSAAGDSTGSDRLVVHLQSLSCPGQAKPRTLFVEVMVRPSMTAGRGARGIENSVFKSRSVEGEDLLTFDQKIVIAPLPEEARKTSVAVFRLKEKLVFGDDLLLGEGLQQLCVLQGGSEGEAVVLALKGSELSAHITYAK